MKWGGQVGCLGRRRGAEAPCRTVGFVKVMMSEEKVCKQKKQQICPQDKTRLMPVAFSPTKIMDMLN